jgi:hypothetical protein
MKGDRLKPFTRLSAAKKKWVLRFNWWLLALFFWVLIFAYLASDGTW